MTIWRQGEGANDYLNSLDMQIHRIYYITATPFWSHLACQHSRTKITSDGCEKEVLEPKRQTLDPGTLQAIRVMIY